MSIARTLTLLSVLFCCPALGEAQTLTTLFNFNGTNGNGPTGRLIQGTDGNLYGTTYSGGTSNNGTVFQMTTGGALTTLVSFDGTNNESPAAGLTQANDGNFYGTTFFGGTLDVGTVFRLTPGGSLTNLVSFNDTNGKFGSSSLLQGSDGSLYGTTRQGGDSSVGTVFRVTLGGSLTTTVNFEGPNGLNPFAGLIQDKAGNFYGTTYAGPVNSLSGGGGSIYRLDPSGSLTTLAIFTGTNGYHPTSALVLGSDGNFYGTTAEGGSSFVDASTTGYGTVFRMTPGGTITTLVNFNGTNGQNPADELIQGKDGSFYGTTITGGSSNRGTVFQVTASGSLTTLVNFTGANGGNPNGGLLQASDGNLYGTTHQGGSSEKGTLFKLALASSSDPFNGVLLGGGYYYSSWFGTYNSQFYPWDYRTDIGFFYVDPVGTDLYLYVLNGNPAPMGWLYTNSTIFPNVYSFTKGSFLYYFDGTTSFANYTTGQIETY